MPGGLFTSRIGPSWSLPDAAREKSEQSQHDDDDQDDPENAQQGLLWMTVCQRPTPSSGYAEAAVPFSVRAPRHWSSREQRAAAAQLPEQRLDVLRRVVGVRRDAQVPVA